uniref:Uncharacterized protein n=1 Tax=Timema poppense TaxID=170557 RepID=A0A7R9DE99_TIMPO|nr:unnamed protein product [Timema poppensis]
MRAIVVLLSMILLAEASTSISDIFQHPLVKRVKVVIETFLMRLNEATTTAKQTIHAVLGAVKHVLTAKGNRHFPLPKDSTWLKSAAKRP